MADPAFNGLMDYRVEKFLPDQELFPDFGMVLGAESDISLSFEDLSRNYFWYVFRTLVK